MSTADPLDRNITISEDERRAGSLSADSRKLGEMLLHCRGYVVLHGAVPGELVDSMRQAFATIYADCAASRAGQDLSIGRETRIVFWERKSRFRIFPRLTGPFASPYVLMNPYAAPLLTGMLGEDLYCKSVSSDTCVKGAILQAPHRDLDFYNGAPSFGYIVNIPLMHCGLHNGPLEVWPGGSHLWRSDLFYRYGVIPDKQDARNPPVDAFMEHLPSKKVELEPGDLLIRDPGMWHRGTPNPTDEPRTMLTTSYIRREFFYDYGDPLRNVDEELFAALDPSVQRLFAYAFDKKSPHYWRLQRYRAISALERRRVLGAPLRIGRRMLERLQTAALGRG